MSSTRLSHLRNDFAGASFERPIVIEDDEGVALLGETSEDTKAQKAGNAPDVLAMKPVDNFDTDVPIYLLKPGQEAYGRKRTARSSNCHRHGGQGLTKTNQHIDSLHSAAHDAKYLPAKHGAEMPRGEKRSIVSVNELDGQDDARKAGQSSKRFKCADASSAAVVVQLPDTKSAFLDDAPAGAPRPVPDSAEHARREGQLETMRRSEWRGHQRLRSFVKCSRQVFLDRLRQAQLEHSGVEEEQQDQQDVVRQNALKQRAQYLRQQQEPDFFLQHSFTEVRRSRSISKGHKSWGEFEWMGVRREKVKMMSSKEVERRIQQRARASGHKGDC